MKKSIVGVLVVCAMSCAAGTVSYSIPVLTVKNDGMFVISGSGSLSRCPFTFMESTNGTPVKVSISEDMPSGAGNSLRASIWLAATTASLILNRDLSGAMICFETSGCVDGPSAGSMFCLAVMSALEGKPFPGDFAMTGTIMADGTVGAVGGVAEKMRAAAQAGVKRICIPASMRLDEDYTDLIDLGKKLGLEVRQVATIADAYQMLHRMPAKQTVRLNSLDVCCLPTHIEDVMKSQFVAFLEDVEKDGSMWNALIKKSTGDYCSGLFGAAMLNIVEGLNAQSVASFNFEPPDPDRYPSLVNELPTNKSFSVGKLLGATPSTAKFVAELMAFHRDLKAAECEDVDCELETDDTDGQDVTMGKESDDWLDDVVVSPCDAQLVTVLNNYLAEGYAYKMSCDDITRDLDSMPNWDGLSAEKLNEIRNLLLRKQDLLRAKSLYEQGGENYNRIDALYAGMLRVMPYIRPNQKVLRVEDLFYRTMRSMGLAFNEKMPKGNGDYLVRRYQAVLDVAETIHARSEKDEMALEAVFSSVQALSWACALYMREASGDLSGRGVGYAAFFSPAVATARENALENINECQKRGIPCVMPIICFQKAESMRDAFSADDDLDYHRFALFENYLEASLSAKALILCFSGQRPELNAKGYCNKGWTYDPVTRIVTFSYFGVSGEPILRDGFSGYTRSLDAEKGDCICWLDADKRVIRQQDTNEFSTLSYDAKGLCSRKTFCDQSWKPVPRKDGVLFETYGYDESGNMTLCEYWGASSNRVVCKDGMAVIKSRFNKRGQETWRRYYGISGEPVVRTDGSAGMDLVYDKAGNQRRFAFVNCDGRPVISKQGFAIEERKYNAQGRVVEDTWCDAHGKLICVGGVARVCLQYDKTGNCIERGFYDEKGNLAIGPDNFAVERTTYDRMGQAVGCHYFGTDGNPTLHMGGCAWWRAELDATGRIVGYKYFDVAGNEVEPKVGRMQE